MLGLVAMVVYSLKEKSYWKFCIVLHTNVSCVDLNLLCPPRLTCSRPYRSEIVMEHFLGYSIMAGRQMPAWESQKNMLVNI
jgi:hypothetical protein